MAQACSTVSVADASRMADIARASAQSNALRFPISGGGLKEREDACVAGCYRCLLSYFNQPDHNLIDRRDPEVTAFFCKLAEPETADDTTRRGPTAQWSSALRQWGLAGPVHAQDRRHLI